MGSRSAKFGLKENNQKVLPDLDKLLHDIMELIKLCTRRQWYYLRLEGLDALLEQPLDLGGLAAGLVLLEELLGAVVVDAVVGVGALHGLGVAQEAPTHHLRGRVLLRFDLLLGVGSVVS